MSRLEAYAVMLWRALPYAERAGRNAERERLAEIAMAMHTARMVLEGEACEDADTLCELAWARHYRAGAVRCCG